MAKINNFSQQLAWESSPATNPVGMYPVKDDSNLPNSVTEDVGGFSLCPSYSHKQLRRINRLKRRKNMQRRENPNSTCRQYVNCSGSKTDLLKLVDNEEGSP
jgi:hypothetical protein